MSDILNIFAIIIAGCSLVFAVISFRKSHFIEKRQLEIIELQEKEKAIERTQAYLFAVIEKQPLQSANLRRQALKDVLVIRNEGFCEARNVVVRLDAKPLMEHPAIPKGLTEINYIGAKSTIGYDLALCMEVSPPFVIEITWEDNSSNNRYYKTTLTI